MWNRKRWMRYSMRLQRNIPSTKRPGNTDSGTATEYSAGEAERQSELMGSRVCGGLLTLDVPTLSFLVGLGAVALCPALRGQQHCGGLG